MSMSTESVSSQINLAQAKSLKLVSQISAQNTIERTEYLEITNRLQTTLDPSKVIELFSREISHLFTFDAISYGNAEAGIKFIQGSTSLHSCSYNLSIENKELGEISFSRNKRFNKHELENLENLLCALIYPLRNALLYSHALNSAFKDALSGIGNRAALETALPREISMAHRNGQPLALAVLDLDLFKQINDTYGHAAGDHAIRSVVDTIQECIRNTDLCFRYGGEEFVLVLNNAQHQGTLNLMERIRQSIEDMECVYNGQRISISISIGLAQLLVGEDQRSLFARADAALYNAKDSGRNQVKSASMEISESTIAEA